MRFGVNCIPRAWLPTLLTAISTIQIFVPSIAAFVPFIALKGKLASEGYILDFETIYQKIAETVEMGGTGVLMQGGLHPDLKIDWFERLLQGIKQRFPQVWLHCFPPQRFWPSPSTATSRCGIPSPAWDPGLASIPGGGAEILDDEVRHRIARLKCSTQDW